MSDCRHFVTHCDHRYLPKALALHASLKRHHSSFILWLVCTSCEAEEYLRALSDETMRVVPLRLVENAYPKLLSAKANRSMVEYYYTLSPAVCKFILDKPECEMVTYLDADIYFFSSPEYIFKLFGQSSVGITPHRLSFWVRYTKKAGEYNVGWITFRKDRDGLSCLDWWFNRCVDWCYQRYENGKYADQGYLNWFPKLFHGVKVLDEPGINLAPWNLANHRVYGEIGEVKVDEKPLVFFHFANFVQISRWHYSTNTAPGLIWLTPQLRKLVFRPYVSALQDIFPKGLPRDLRRFSVHDFFSHQIVKKVLKTTRNIIMFQYVFVIGDRVF